MNNNQFIWKAVEKKKQQKKKAHAPKSGIMIFTCATLQSLIGRNLLDQTGMFLFK